MQTLGRLLQYTANTLDISSGANDVIVVKWSDGTLKSTPFQVRFGKAKVLRPSDKIVQVEVNGELTSAIMKIGPDGFAYWLEPCTQMDQSNLESPINIETLPVQKNMLENLETVNNLDIAEKKTNQNLELQRQFQQPPNDPDDELKPEEKAKYASLIKSLDESKHVSTTPPLTPKISLIESAPFNSASSWEEQKSSLEYTGSNVEEPPELTLKTFSPSKQVDDRIAGNENEKLKEFNSNPLEITEEKKLKTTSSFSDPIDYDDEDDGNESLGVDDSSIRSDSEYSNRELVLTLHPDTSEQTWFKRSLIPCAADLDKLNLKEGMNVIRYRTLTSFRGAVVEEARVYLWSHNVKCVVSDVDGTITRSDILGHLLPMVGKDWTHRGICDLYTKIAQNGYQFIYLTARSASLLSPTKKFLWGIEQNGKRLPLGPIITAPDKFFTALSQEMTKRSHEFKISALNSVRKVFPPKAHPLYAGFGNRIGDVIAYNASAIPESKVFIIDHEGVVHVLQAKHSYANLSELVHETFPVLKSWQCVHQYPHMFASHPRMIVPHPHRGCEGEVMLPEVDFEPENPAVVPEFNSFNYWKIDPAEVVASSKKKDTKKALNVMLTKPQKQVAQVVVNTISKAQSNDGNEQQSAVGSTAKKDNEFFSKQLSEGTAKKLNEQNADCNESTVGSGQEGADDRKNHINSSSSTYSWFSWKK